MRAFTHMGGGRGGGLGEGGGVGVLGTSMVASQHNIFDSGGKKLSHIFLLPLTQALGALTSEFDLESNALPTEVCVWGVGGGGGFMEDRVGSASFVFLCVPT